MYINFLAGLILLVNGTAFAESTCEVVGRSGAVVIAYCPKSMKIEDVTTVVKSYGELHFNKQLNQVHVYVFNNKKITPKNASEMMKMSERSVDEHQIATFSLNKNSNYFEYWCKRTNAKKIEDCKDLYK